MYFRHEVNGVEFDVTSNEEDDLIRFTVTDYTHKKQINQNLTITDITELKAKLEMLITNYNHE